MVPDREFEVPVAAVLMESGETSLVDPVPSVALAFKEREASMQASVARVLKAQAA